MQATKEEESQFPSKKALKAPVVISKQIRRTSFDYVNFSHPEKSKFDTFTSAK